MFQTLVLSRSNRLVPITEVILSSRIDWLLASFDIGPFGGTQMRQL